MYKIVRLRRKYTFIAELLTIIFGLTILSVPTVRKMKFR